MDGELLQRTAGDGRRVISPDNRDCSICGVAVEMFFDRWRGQYIRAGRMACGRTESTGKALRGVQGCATLR